MNDPESNPFEDSPKEAADTSDPRRLAKPWQDPYRFDEHEVQASYISGTFPGIAMAGCAYPAFMGGIVLIIGGLYSGSLDELPLALFVFAFYTVIGGAFGAVVAAISAMFSIALVILMNRSLSYPLDARSAAISAGSLAGYAPTVWVLFSPGISGQFSQAAVAGFLGPILAMTLGAIGAAWASSVFSSFDFSVATRPRKSRLTIMHMMIATSWIAVTFAIANVFGGLGFAAAAAGWFFLQGIMLSIIHLYRTLRKPVRK